MKNILVPTDFSDCANNALRYAITLAQKNDASVTLLSAYHVPSAGGTSVMVNLQDDLKEAAEEELKKIKAKLAGEYPNLQVNIFTSYNLPVNAVLKYVKEKDVDMIVMGTTGASGVKEVFVGSTTSSLVNKVKIPVFAIPESFNNAKLSKIYLATDLKSFKSTDSTKFIKKLALDFGAKVELLNVAEKPNEEESFKIVSEAIDIDNEFVGVEHEFNFLESTDIEKAILDYIDEDDSVIAVINRERSFFDRLFHKSLSKKITMHANVPILVLHD